MEARTKDVIGFVAQIRADEMSDAANHEPASDQQCRRGGDLQHDKDRASAAHGWTVGAGAGLAAQAICEARGTHGDHRQPCDDHSDQQAGAANPEQNPAIHREGGYAARHGQAEPGFDQRAESAQRDRGYGDAGGERHTADQCRLREEQARDPMRLGSECHANRCFLLPAQRPQEHEHRYIGHHDEQHEGGGDSDADQSWPHVAHVVRVNRFQSDTSPASGNLRSDAPHGFGDPPRREGGRHALTQAHHVCRARGREGQGRVGGTEHIVADIAEARRQDAADAIFGGRITGVRGADTNGLSEALGLAPKRSRQRASPIMMTRSPPGRKSSSENTRPSAARTPMASREPGAHCSDEISCG